MKIQKKQEIEFFGTKTGNANSIALGYATETKNFGEVAVGVMNKSTAAKDPNSSKGVCIDPDATLFSVGCGGSGERKNALEVKGDGSVIIPGENGNINIADKIKQAFDTDASIKLVKSAEDSLQYTLMVNNESRGSINIPKDQFLKNVTYDSEGKQLVFTFVTLDEDEHVERVPVGDLKDIYTAGEGITINGDNVISADFSSVMTAISDEKTLRETTDNEIKSTLDTKADKTDVNNRLDDLRNRCFKLGGNGEIMTPIGTGAYTFNKPIQQLNNNEKYSYGDINVDLPEIDEPYIYDKTIDTFIKVIGYERFSFDPTNTFFKTDKSLDLNHTFYLDNEKTGIVENLTQLNIEASNVFVNLPYIEVNNNLNEYEASQYIYDATDNKWIEVVECYSLEYGCVFFNTELPLNLNDDLYYSYTSTFTTEWSISNGANAIAIGYDSASNGTNAIAIGYGSASNGTNATAIGYDSASNGENTIAIGYNTKANADLSIAIGEYISINHSNSTALGNNIRNCSENSIAIGRDISKINNNAIAIGYNIYNTNEYSVAIGDYSQSKFPSSLSLGAYSKAGGDYAIALGCNVSNTKSIFGVGFDGVNGIDMDRDNYGLYLKGFGGYDGTNLVVKNEGTETLNPNIKSVQQIINEKADVSAIPTKVSQLTNDSFPTPNDIAVFAGLTIHNNAQIRYIQKTGGSKGTYLVAETPADRVANKVYAADGSLFDVGKLVKTIDCKVSGDWHNIEFGYTNANNERSFILIPNVTKLAPGIMTAADKVKLDNLQELVELKIVGTSESSVAMKPNKVYEITVGSALTITLEEPTDKTVYNEYQGTFDTGDTIPTVTFPSNVRWNDTPNVGANQHVEFSIRYSGGKYYGICQVWDITKLQSV